MNPMGGDGDGGFGGIDFSKLGAAQGMGGMPDLGEMANADEDSDDDDEDMPELEGDDEKPEAATEAAKKTEEASTTAAPKIQEVE